MQTHCSWWQKIRNTKHSLFIESLAKNSPFAKAENFFALVADGRLKNKNPRNVKL